MEVQNTESMDSQETFDRLVSLNETLQDFGDIVSSVSDKNLDDFDDTFMRAVCFCPISKEMYVEAANAYSRFVRVILSVYDELLKNSEFDNVFDAFITSASRVKAFLESVIDYTRSNGGYSGVITDLNREIESMMNSASDLLDIAQDKNLSDVADELEDAFSCFSSSFSTLRLYQEKVDSRKTEFEMTPEI